MLRASSVLIACLVSTVALAFGGEAVPGGDPWHHYDITVRALAGDETGFGWSGPTPYAGVGFSQQAAHAVAWHADNIDAYLYSPIFWAKGGLMGTGGFDLETRIRGAAVAHGELAKLHFDDNPNARGVLDAWERYGSGTLAALEWSYQAYAAEGASATERARAVAAAHLVLGYSSHAVQDFYAHSSWLDAPERWHRTFLELDPTSRSALDLRTGSYEHAFGTLEHGKYSAACTVLSKAGDARRALDLFCHEASPFVHTSTCEQVRMCGTDAAGVELEISKAGAVRVQQAPVGIAIDNSWLARLGGRTRGVLTARGRLADGFVAPADVQAHCASILNLGLTMEGNPLKHADDALQRWKRPAAATPCGEDDLLFATGKHLATRTTSQWITALGETFVGTRGGEGRLGRAAFWSAVAQASDAPWVDRVAQVEELHRVPYVFLSAGPYPVDHPAVFDRVGDFEGSRVTETSSAGVYLRLETTTGRDGTDGNVHVALTDGGSERRYRLDLMPTNTRGGTPAPLTHDDFQPGARAAYVVGPLRDVPASVELSVQGVTPDELLGLAIEDLEEAVVQAWTDARRLGTRILGGNADRIGDGRALWSASELASMVGKGRQELDLDGGEAGQYRLGFTVREGPATADGRAFVLSLEQLHCVRETGGVGSDEPFLFALAVGYNGATPNTPEGTWIGPLDDDRAMDSGDTYRFERAHEVRLQVPDDGRAKVGLFAQVWESDLETVSDRRSLWTQLQTGLSEAEVRSRSKAIDRLGGLRDADVDLDAVRVFAFRRGPDPAAGYVGALAKARVTPERTAVIDLDASGLRPLGSPDRSVLSHQPVVTEVDGPALTFGQQTWALRRVASVGTTFTYTVKQREPIEAAAGRELWVLTFETRNTAVEPSLIIPKTTASFLVGVDERAFPLLDIDGEAPSYDILAPLATKRTVRAVFETPVGFSPVEARFVNGAHDEPAALTVPLVGDGGP